jgi:hypothetical protein
MANTFVKIATATVGSGGSSSIDFSSIPQTYTDLIVKISARNNEADTAASLRFYFNGDTGNINVREARANNATLASYSISYAQAGYVAADQTDANCFGASSIYVPNYTSSNYKSSSAETVSVSNTSAQNFSVFSARLWSSTSAVNQITITSSGTWQQYTTAVLYGIKKS